MLDVASRKSWPASLPSPRTALTLIASGLLLLLPVVLVSLSFWPGHMNADTLGQIEQVRRGALNNQHAALLLAIWIPLWDIGVGPGDILTGQVIVFVIGLFLVLRATFSTFTASLASALISLSPPIFGMLGLLGRDVWFIAFLLLTFGLLFTALRARGRARMALMIGVLVAAWLALAARQNAAAAVIMATIAWVALIRGSAVEHRVRHVAVTIVAGVGVTVGLMASQFAMAAALDVRNAYPEHFLYVYDVAAISHRERENLFPPNVMPDRGLAAIDQRFHVDNVVPLVVGPGNPIEPFLDADQVESLSEAWRDAIIDHPLAYLDGRWDIFWRQVALTRAASFIYHPWIDNNSFGLEIRFPEFNDAAKAYVEAFADDAYDGDVLFRVWIYLLAALLIGIFLLARGRSALERGVGVFALSAITYQFGLAIGAMGVGYRLEYPAVVISMASIVLLIGVLVKRRREPVAT